MKRKIIITKKVILCSLSLCFNVIIFGQIRQEIDVDTMINNECLRFKLKTSTQRLVSLEIKNKTLDTILVRTRLKIEQKRALCYITAYEKTHKNNGGKDSVYYQSGALWDYYGDIIGDTEQYIRVFGEGKRFLEKLPPKTEIIVPLTYFSKGEYYLKIQTIYVYRKKMYFARTETNKIRVR